MWLHRNATAIVTEIEHVIRNYGNYDLGPYDDQNQERAALMKARYAELWRGQQSSGQAFKPFLKIGNMHSGRGCNDLGVYDIGNLVSSLESARGQTSLHIFQIRRFRADGSGGVADYLPDGYETLKNFGLATDRDRFLLVDLELFRKKMLNAEIKVTLPDERNLILSHDLALLTPVDPPYEGSLNWEPKQK